MDLRAWNDDGRDVEISDTRVVVFSVSRTGFAPGSVSFISICCHDEIKLSLKIQIPPRGLEERAVSRQ
jgi:hypothetical protein